jgi:chromate transporter
VTPPAAGPAPAASPPVFAEALRFWIRLGWINFGGPAGQIAIMHREIVERRGWMREDQFLRGLNVCMILPGPEAQQLATYIGWRLHGTRGGVAAGAFFVIPSIVVLMLLSWLAAARAGVPAIAGLLYGVQPVVVAIVADALLRIGRRSLRHPVLWLFAAAAFAAIVALRVPFPVIVAVAGAAGALLARPFPGVFGTRAGTTPGADAPARHRGTPPSGPWLGRVTRIVALFAALWAVPVGALWWWRGAGDVLVREALFFTKAAFVTFGGAYAVLAYVADVAVNRFGWLSAAQMVQGLGLAESTPGPLIMVTQFVGFFGGWNGAGGHDPLLYGILGGLVTTWVTFLPSFMFIIVGAPWIEALAAAPRLHAAFTGVTAAVVGVILNLAVFFGTRVLWPAAGGPDGFALIAAAAAFLLLRSGRLPIALLIAAGAVAGMVRALAG